MSLANLLSPEFLISSFGLLGIFVIVFAESGLLFGFFLPGDSLLLTAGLFASRGSLDLFTLVILCALGAILGDTVGYWFGRKTGNKLFNREESSLFKKSHLQKAQAFYDQHGGKTIILALFMPFVRTFAPIVAGAAKMDYKKFFIYNLECVCVELPGINITNKLVVYLLEHLIHITTLFGVLRHIGIDCDMVVMTHLFFSSVDRA